LGKLYYDPPFKTVEEFGLYLSGLTWNEVYLSFDLSNLGLDPIENFAAVFFSFNNSAS